MDTSLEAEPRTATDEVVSAADVRAAAARIDGFVRQTPVLPTSFGGGAGPLLLKAECLQVTGSFKVRGAGNAVARLGAEARRHGLVTHSSGNHAQALARAAREAGIALTVVMPRSTPEIKVRATRKYGAEIVLVDASQRASRVEEIVAETGATFVPPFDDLDIIAGQGTVGLEILAQVATVESVWVPVSGGGLISGIGALIKALSPQTRVIGVEPELAADLVEGLALGRRTSWPADRTARTIADGLRVQAVGLHNWTHITRFVDDVVTVSEEQIRRAMARVVIEAHLVCEPSGAVSVAGYLAHRELAGHGPAVAVVSGGNVAPALLAEVVQSGAGSPPAEEYVQ